MVPNTPSIEFENQLRQTLAVPEIQPEFSAALENELMRQFQANTTVAAKPIWLQRRWLMAELLIVLLSISIMVIGPQRVAAAFQNLLGFLPGFGYVQGDVRILEEPVPFEQPGLRVEVTEAVIDAEHTWLTIEVIDEALENTLDSDQLEKVPAPSAYFILDADNVVLAGMGKYCTR